MALPLITLAVISGCAGNVGQGGGVIAPPTQIEKPAIQKTVQDTEKPPSETTNDEVARILTNLEKNVPAEPGKGKSEKPAKPEKTGKTEKPVAEKREPGPKIVGEDGTGGDLTPRAAEALKGRLKPPASIDIDGDGKPDIEVTKEEGASGGYRVVYYEPGERAASMVWVYNEAGKLLRFERDVDRDGISDEIVLSYDEDGVRRVYRSKSGEAFLVDARGGNIIAQFWDAAAGRPLAGELISNIGITRPWEKILGEPPAEEAVWSVGKPLVYIRREGRKTVEKIEHMDGVTSDETMSIRMNVIAKKQAVIGRLREAPAVKGELLSNELNTVKTSVLMPVKPDFGALLAGTVLEQNGPAGYELYRLGDVTMPEVRGIPGEILSAWKRSVSRIFVEDLAPAEKWKARILAEKDGRVIWERRDRDGDGICETKVLSQTKSETVTERIENHKTIREVCRNGALAEIREGNEGKDTFYKVTFFENGKLVKVEIDTKGKGHFDRWEFPEENKALIDTNDDGLPDKWETLKGETKSGDGK